MSDDEQNPNNETARSVEHSEPPTEQNDLDNNCSASETPEQITDRCLIEMIEAGPFPGWRPRDTYEPAFWGPQAAHVLAEVHGYTVPKEQVWTVERVEALLQVVYYERALASDSTDRGREANQIALDRFVRQAKLAARPARVISREVIRARLLACSRSRKIDAQSNLDAELAKDMLAHGYIYNPLNQGYAADLLVRIAPEATTAQLAEFLRGAEVLIDGARHPPSAFADAGKATRTRKTLASLSEEYAWVELRNRLILVGEKRPHFVRKEQFLTTYENQSYEGKALGEVWFQHEDRPTYRDAQLYPPPLVCPEGHFNLWRGFAIEPKPGDWSLMRAHIHEVIAGGNAEYAEYLLKWIAWTFQNPGIPAEVALVLLGGKGTGKGTLGNALAKIFGAHATHISNPEHFAGGKFNAHLAGSVFLFADECYWPGNKSHQGNLKAMVTEPEIFIEPKGIDGYGVHNVIHCLVATNEKWAVPATADERRFVVLRVSEHRRQNLDYFAALNAEMDNGGLAAMLHDLLAMDLRGWHPRQIVRTDELYVQAEENLGDAEKWLLEILDAGELPRGFGSNVEKGWITNAALTEALESACKRPPQTKARGDLLRSAGATSGKNAQDVRGWRFPALAEARKKWCETHWPRRWDNETAEWG